MNREGKDEYLKEKKDISTISKRNNDTPTSRNHDIKCFCCLGFGHFSSQCPNNRVMFIKVNNEFETYGKDEEEKMSLL